MRARRLPALSRQTGYSVTPRINNMAASNLLPLAVAIVVSLPGVLLLSLSRESENNGDSDTAWKSQFHTGKIFKTI